MTGYTVFDDPYCYKGTFVLKNRASIKDGATLEAFELEMSTLRADEPLPTGTFSPTHYKKVHHHLFQDVYPWAGRYRTVRTAKGGNWFCYPEYIDSYMKKLFERLSGDAFKPDSNPDDFINAAADFLTELNAIHPFREGNGRSQLSFMHLLGLRAGHALHLERIQRDTFLPAMIASFSGEIRPLKAELQKLLS